MPSEIKWEKDFVKVTYTDPLEGSMVIDVIHQVFGNPKFAGLCYQLSDFSNVSGVNFDANMIKTVGAMDKMVSYWKRDLFIANIINQDLLPFVPLYKSFSKTENWIVKFFMNRAEGMEWLAENGLRTKDIPS